MHLPKRQRGDVCIVRIDLIGDFVLFTPALRALREFYADKLITIVVKSQVADLVAECPYVDKIVVINDNQFRKNPFYRIIFLLRMYCSNNAITLYPCYSRNTVGDMITLWSGSAERIGWNSNGSSMDEVDKRRGDAGYTSLVTQNFEPEAHEITRNLAFIKALGVRASGVKTELWPNNNAIAEADALLQRNNLAGRVLVAILPGASFPIKKWGNDNYLELCRELLDQMGDDIFFAVCGQSGDRLDTERYGEKISSHIVDLTGQTTLQQLTAILSRCSLVVGNDTGTMHIAIAVGACTVCVLGGGHYGRFMPYADTQRNIFLNNRLDCYQCDWVCNNESPACITSIPISQVRNSCINLMSNSALSSNLQ